MSYSGDGSDISLMVAFYVEDSKFKTFNMALINAQFGPAPTFSKCAYNQWNIVSFSIVANTYENNKKHHVTCKDYKSGLMATMRPSNPPRAP